MNMKKDRLKLGLSQRDLAKLVGVSLPTIATWEQGVGQPSESNYKKLRLALGYQDEEEEK